MFDTIKFSELAPFKNILFEVLPNNPEFNIEEVKANWNELELDKKKDQYMLTLLKKGVKRSILVQPVITKENKAVNQAIFTQLYEKSRLENTELYQKEQTILDSLKTINKNITDSISFINQRAINRAYESSEEVKNQNLVYRTFTIENFGIFNSDCPTNLPSGITIENPIFVNKKDTLKFHKLFIAEYGTNTIYTLYEDSFISSISYNPTKPAVIWGVTNKNKLAVFNFKDYSQKLKSSKILMDLNELNSATNVDSIRNALQWQ